MNFRYFTSNATSTKDFNFALLLAQDLLRIRQAILQTKQVRHQLRRLY